MDMDKLAAMSCNPAVGGVAKGQIVREIDALGGQMGRITDLATIQFRMLNRSKGAAMWSPRAQCDKRRFSDEWRHTLENTLNLYIWQDTAAELLFETDSPTEASTANAPRTNAAGIASTDGTHTPESISVDTRPNSFFAANKSVVSSISADSSAAKIYATDRKMASGEIEASAINPATNEASTDMSPNADVVPAVGTAFGTGRAPAVGIAFGVGRASAVGIASGVIETLNTVAAAIVSATPTKATTPIEPTTPTENAVTEISHPTENTATTEATHPTENAATENPSSTGGTFPAKTINSTGVSSTQAITGNATPAETISIAEDSSSAEAAAPKPRIRGVRTRMGVEFSCRAIILTSGTFLDGLMHCGTSNAEGGRAGDSASHGITECLRKMGFESGRMKTGTPARLDARTINFEILEPQYGDEKPAKFSFSSETEPVKHQLPCFLVYTSSEVHETLRAGFDKSPLFNGTICGIGPRYCPSIEDKLRTFADKDQHQLFLEPEGLSTNEYYLNGFSSSLPWEVQWEALHKIRGFEDLHIFRPGYAIEYDYFPPTQLHHSLETKLISGLFFAGQVNGTTGYEEAAAQGLIAGVNAHRLLEGKKAVVLQRDEAYIGVLIDDLVTKGVDEPYRMFTSRAEYRILLRQDNADIRLSPLGHKIGLLSQERFDNFVKKNTLVESLIEFTRGESVKASEINDYLKSINSDVLTQGRKLYDILMRNDVTFESLSKVLPRLVKFISKEGITAEAIEEAEIQIKYRGYIEREKFIADKLHRLENISIPTEFDFHSMNSLTIEARQKLSRIRPATIGQASRIPGVSPADVNVLLVKFGR